MFYKKILKEEFMKDYIKVGDMEIPYFLKEEKT